jgi:hypothetical protein
MKKEELREVHAVGTSEAGRSAVAAREEAYHRYRLLATMVQGTAAALPEAWQSYRNVEEARIGAGRCCTITASCESRLLKIAFRCSSSNVSADDADSRFDSSVA